MDFMIIDNFVPPSGQYLQRLIAEVPFSKVEWRKGKFLPRLCYRNGPLDDCIPVLEELKALIEKEFGTIDGMWCNLYRNGLDYTPHHQDSYRADVYTLSFGATRKFQLKSAEGTETVELKDRSLVFFSESFDASHTHSIPKQISVKKSRVSIVFFQVKVK